MNLVGIFVTRSVILALCVPVYCKTNFCILLLSSGELVWNFSHYSMYCFFVCGTVCTGFLLQNFGNILSMRCTLHECCKWTPFVQMSMFHKHTGPSDVCVHNERLLSAHSSHLVIRSFKRVIFICEAHWCCISFFFLSCGHSKSLCLS